MKISELSRGARCRVPGIDLDLEVLKQTPSSTRVRPTGFHAVVWQDLDGEEVQIFTRPKAFGISGETIVEVLP